MIHVITANRYNVSPSIIEAGTKGSYGNDFLRLALSSEWDGLTVKASFYPLHSAPIAVIYSGSDIPIPGEVYDYSGDTEMVISGENLERELITLRLVLKVLDTRVPANTPPRPPAPSEIAQVYEYMREAVNTAESVRKDADSGLFDGEDGFSPTVGIKQTDTGHDITVTDANGEKTFTVRDGKDGKDGKDGEANYNIGSGLKLDPETNTLSVDIADNVEEDNTKPITSAAVYETVGNINALLASI